MAVEPLDDDDFRAKLEGAERAVVHFYAAWCGPCLLFQPRFVRVSEECPHIGFFVIDGEASPRARESVEIENLPYFGLYRRGEHIGGFSTSREASFRQQLEEHFGSLRLVR